jgi:hypothetical protein
MKLEELEKMPSSRLRQISSKIRNILMKKEAVAKTKVLKKYVGKYFKAKNCFSCPESEEDYWTIYIHVLGLTEDGWLDFVSFQKNIHDNISIDRSTLPNVSGWTSSTQEEFNSALSKIMDELQLLFVK